MHVSSFVAAVAFL